MMVDEAVVLMNEVQGSPVNQLFKMVIRSEIAHKAEAGQFIHIKVGDGLDPLLRRPLSISEIDRGQETITIYYRVKGKGTTGLSRVKLGDRINAIGPLGTGFALPQVGEELWLVAGGIGIFPLYALAEEAQCQGIPLKLYWGGENVSFLESAGVEKWQQLKLETSLTTMDGSRGERGLITGPLFRDLTDFKDFTSKNDKKIKIAACGPTPMLKAVADFCKEQGIPCEVSLEERMACGVGACLGCSCVLQRADGSLKRGRVCKDGPVFAGEEVVWDELR